jgi:hypothetical protein
VRWPPVWPGTGIDPSSSERSSGRPAFEPPWTYGREPYPRSTEERAAARRLLSRALEASETDSERARILAWLAEMSDDVVEARRLLDLAVGLEGDLLALAFAKVRRIELGEAGGPSHR